MPILQVWKLRGTEYQTIGPQSPGLGENVWDEVCC